MSADTPDIRTPIGQNLFDQMALITKNCIECPKCTTQCAFLKECGNPKTIAQAYDPERPDSLTLPFMCNLCDLCEAVCPVGLSPGQMFLEMRREAVARGAAPLPEHKGIMGYERKGVSTDYSWYSLPDPCDTVFFPGCTFAGTRSDTTLVLYEYLKTLVPNLGIVLDCCTKPSHDLGRKDYFDAMFGEMKDWLAGQGVKSVLVVCPNCFKVFKQYGAPLAVTSVYDCLAEKGVPAACPDIRKTVTIHDPCVLRNEPSIQDAVRTLAAGQGYTVEEMPHSRKKTVCCGEGGTVGAMAPNFSSAWRTIRKKEASGRNMLTYCAGCAGLLNRQSPTDHILDAVFYPEAVAAGRRKATVAPFTYLNRKRLKRVIREKHPASVTRERVFQADSEARGSMAKALVKLLVLALIAGTIAGIHASGQLDRFDTETLRAAVASSGALAPVMFILIYAVAPSLFLPGLPITLVGGILFGPVWGVVYSIIGATTGASLAFLIARYVARDWIKGKLTGPRWRKLDQGVAKNGWKIVAFTRLVPLFPFNLLNYAFGLTPIRFLPYVLTSFVCMLPACIAFIVFSSSLPDLVKGRVSKELIIGVLLIAVVSMIPMLVGKIRKKENHDLG